MAWSSHLPNHQHGPAALAAIQAGLPILLEKPIASDIGTAREVVAAADAAGVRIAMSLPQRQRPSLIRLRHLIKSGTLAACRSGVDADTRSVCCALFR